MAFDYQPFRDLAIDLLQEFGTTVTLRSRSNVYVPGEGTTDTVVEQTGRGVLKALAVEDRPAELVERNVQQIVLSPSGITTPPEPGDEVVIGGIVWTVQSVEIARPATVTLLYKLLVTR